MEPSVHKWVLWVDSRAMLLLKKIAEGPYDVVVIGSGLGA